MPSKTTLLESANGLVYCARSASPRRPLIVMLHGLSGDENAMWLFDRALPRLANAIAPRALFASSWGGYSWTRSAEPRDLDDVDFSEAIEALQDFIPEMIQRYEADPQRVIVMGFSQGAALSYALSLAAPEMIGGTIALAGFMPGDGQHPTWRAAQPTAGTRRERKARATESKEAFRQWGYLIIHGLYDEEVPIDRARQARAVLEARGAAIEYHEYPIGHKVPAQGLRDIQQWLKRVL